MKPDKSSILIAEDNMNDVFLVKSAFAEAAPQMALSVVGNGEELIGYLKSKLSRNHNRLPALVLLDLKMPRMDGFEALKWIRNQPALKRLLVIVFSSSGESGQINRAYDLGANSYLMKPFDYKQLTDLVRRLLMYWIETNLAPTFSAVTADSTESSTESFSQDSSAQSKHHRLL